MVFSLGLFFSYYAANNILLIKISATVNDPFQISNDMVNDNYLTYIKEIVEQRIQLRLSEGNRSRCHWKAMISFAIQVLRICKIRLKLDDEIVDKLSKNIDKDKQVLADKFEKLRERMEKAISEEEEEGIMLPEETKKKIDADDLQATEIHNQKRENNVGDGDVLEGASNAKDLKVLAECQDALVT